jgi:HlyD family secretion protein
MKRRMLSLKWGIAMVVVTLAVLSAGTYYATSRDKREVAVTTSAITKGSVVEAVSASGTVEATTSVQVGSQVSGSVQALYADFNSIVRKGQVLARLDPSLLESQAEQARANVARAEADVERLRVALADTETKLQRAQELAARRLIPQTDLDAADIARRSAQAQVKSAEAQVVQARASLGQAEVNVQKTVITSPIDGIVVGRDVDVGQTVAASLQAPTLFLIAADLTRMRVNASIDESDIGRVAEGQVARFQVDAFPNEQFEGTVRQVRLQPVVVQNVVTYAVLIDVPNPELKLRPGMTANVTVEIGRRDNVLRLSNAALRFKPSEAMFAALGQTAPASPAGARDARAPRGARVWMMSNGALTAVPVRLGLSDGTFTELMSGTLSAGAELVTTIATSTTTTQKTATATNPLFGAQPGPGGMRGAR